MVLVVLWKWIAQCRYISWCCMVYLTARIVIVTDWSEENSRVVCAHVHNILVTECNGPIS